MQVSLRSCPPERARSALWRRKRRTIMRAQMRAHGFLPSGGRSGTSVGGECRRFGPGKSETGASAPLPLYLSSKLSLRF